MQVKHHSIFRAIVKDNKDPKNLRRVKVSVPQITGEEVSEWIWPVEDTSIDVQLPVIGQGVWIFFIGGDPEYPVWLGTYGNHPKTSKRLYVEPLSNSVSISGISSYFKTAKQKDGTTDVFKMFLGNVIHKAERKNDSLVEVRAITYKVDDDDFNKVVYDFRGNPQYSTMITKLCNYNRRSEFIIKVLSSLLEENPNQHIMILAHNKCLLKYLV